MKTSQNGFASRVLLWQGAIDCLLTNYASTAPAAAVRLARARLLDRGLDMESEKKKFARKLRFSEAFVRGSECAIAVLGAALLGVTAFLQSGPDLVLMSATLAVAFARQVAVHRTQRLATEVALRTHIVTLQRAAPLLELTKVSGRAQHYVAQVMNLYNEFRGVDYAIALALAETEVSFSPTPATVPEHDAALWKLFEVEVFSPCSVTAQSA